MLFCRVLLGDIHICHKYDQDKYRTAEMFQRGHAVRRPNKPSVRGGLSVMSTTGKRATVALVIVATIISQWYPTADLECTERLMSRLHVYVVSQCDG